MTKTPILSLAAVALFACATSCTSSDTNFRAMSAEQLAAHNAGLSAGDQVVCVEERRTGSHLKRTVCMTNREFQLRDLGVTDDINSAGVDNRVGIDAF
ncbi:MAG: hypothetical protein Q8L60_06655 [Gammaproteobacteria bacterium]|nr:hypothetical protein [Gammaproteobacteria bacterium]MDP2140297.1 hypothetical protein [Gammaproteobacteria bacterium]MDP2346185.1 hypothetical protein [Gammaproteobacteria bacterium]